MQRVTYWLNCWCCSQGEAHTFYRRSRPTDRQLQLRPEGREYRRGSSWPRSQISLSAAPPLVALHAACGVWRTLWYSSISNMVYETYLNPRKYSRPLQPDFKSLPYFPKLKKFLKKHHTYMHSHVPRPSPASVVDGLQYARTITNQQLVKACGWEYTGTCSQLQLLTSMTAAIPAGTCTSRLVFSSKR